jgi:hypothetical protein
MTTFQDPQPQSRRAVRQSERGDGLEAQSEFPQFPPAPQAAPQFYPNTPSSEDMWDTTSRRAAQLPPASPPTGASAPVTGRRAAAAAPTGAEPLNYSTLNTGTPSAASHAADPATAAQAPVGTDPQSFRSRLDARQAAQTQAAQTQAAHAQAAHAAPAAPVYAAPPQEAQAEQPIEPYRIRDFSPDGRRAAQAAAAPPAAPVVSPPSDLDYQTEVRPGFGSHAAYSPPAPVAAVPPTIATPPVAHESAQPQPIVAAPYTDAPGEQTMSRRELRAMLAAQEAAAGHAPLQEPAPWVSPRDYSQIQQEQQPVAAAPVVQQVAPPQQAPQAAQQQPPQVWEATRMPEAAMPSSAPAPTNGPVLSSALAEFDSLTSAPVVEEPTAWSPPVGHWSTQLDDDDAGDEYDTTINRRVGSGMSTTSALVLPTVPPGSDIRGPLTRTGEVMLTGSIDLPRDLAAMGVSDRMDHGGIDSLFDANDHEIIATDSAPVRAVTAVSTHSSGHPVTHTQKPKGTRALTALLISASAMAVVVAGLLIAAFAFKIL